MGRAQRIFRVVKIFCVIYMKDIHHYTFVQSHRIECTTPTVNPKANYGLWLIMMCQCRFVLD